MLKARVYSLKATKLEDVSLPKEFGMEANLPLLAQAVRVYEERSHIGLADTQTRADVNRTTKKVYKQKGTGGARHGARSAPIYVGGGRAHGPKNFENYKLELPKKMARLAFISSLSDKVTNKKLSVALDLEGIEPKTKNLNTFLKKAGFKKLTLVHSGKENIFRAGRNIENLSLVRAQELSTYDVIKASNLVLTQEAVEVLTKRGVKNA